MLGNTLPLPGLAGKRRMRRGSLTTALRQLLLCGRLGSGNKTVNFHYPAGHHVFTLIGFGFRGVNKLNSCLFSLLNRSLWFNRGFKLNRLVSLFSTALRHTVSRLVSYRCKFVSTSIPWTKVSSLAYCEFQRKKVWVPYVNRG